MIARGCGHSSYFTRHTGKSHIKFNNSHLWPMSLNLSNWRYVCVAVYFVFSLFLLNNFTRYFQRVVVLVLGVFDLNFRVTFRYCKVYFFFVHVLRNCAELYVLTNFYICAYSLTICECVWVRFAEVIIIVRGIRWKDDE